MLAHSRGEGWFFPRDTPFIHLRFALMEALESMTDSDRDNIAAFLESKGAYTDVVATEETREFNEYHIDYMYRMDTQKVIDVKAKMEMQDRSLETIEPTDIIVRTQGSMGSDFEIDRITNMSFAEVREILQDMALLDKNEWDGNVQEYLEQRGAKLIPIKASDGLNEEYPSFFDLEYDFDSNGVTDISDLSMMKQADFNLWISRGEGSPTNIEMFLDSLQRVAPADTEGVVGEKQSGWLMGLKKVSLRDSRFTYREEEYEPVDYGVNWTDVECRDLNVDITDFDFGDEYSR